MHIIRVSVLFVVRIGVMHTKGPIGASGGRYATRRSAFREEQ